MVNIYICLKFSVLVNFCIFIDKVVWIKLYVVVDYSFCFNYYISSDCDIIINIG